jgi:hypothetical protein
MIPGLVILTIAVFMIAAVLLLAAGRLRSGTHGNSAEPLQPIDIDAFRNLISEPEELYLREHMPPHEFRTVHRERMLAASEYVWGAARNAGILIRLAERAKQNADREMVASAESLQDNAFRLRLYAWQTLPRLYFAALLPGAGSIPQALAESYDRLTRQMITLKCMQSAKLP